MLLALAGLLVIALSAGALFQFTGTPLFGVIANDFSTVTSDSITLAPPFNVRDRFDRTLSLELKNHPGDLSAGKYTAAVHWEVVPGKKSGTNDTCD